MGVSGSGARSADATVDALGFTAGDLAYSRNHTPCYQLLFEGEQALHCVADSQRACGSPS